MKMTAERLYKLLPAIYRIRDAELDTPLKDLIAVIAEQAALLEEDITRLYDNWFIETCEEWVIPYIGDLLGVRGLHSIIAADAFSQRARVANTLSYRRRKGTATVLEQLARDTTGWRARAVEFFELLGTTQHYNHLRMHSLYAPDLRRTARLELLDTAFDTIAHTVDVRNIGGGRGRHNIPNIGLFMWRLQNYNVTRSTAKAVDTPSKGRYTFSPLGYDTQLFNKPHTETEITHLAEEINVPGLLRRRALFDELNELRAALAEGKDKGSIEAEYFGPDPVIEVYFGDNALPLDPEKIVICDLANWNKPGWERPPSKEFIKLEKKISTKYNTEVAVDPVNGRLSVLKDIALPDRIRVSYSYGSSGDVGGGPYNRRESIDKAINGKKVDWQAGVGKNLARKPPEIFNTLTDAIAEWKSRPPGSLGVIAVLDSQTYAEDLNIEVPGGSKLIITAADWPEVEAQGLKERIKGQLNPDGLRPHLIGDIEVTGTAAEGTRGGELVLDGFLIEGNMTVKKGNLGHLRIAHSTLVHDIDKILVDPKGGNEQLKIEIVHTICGLIDIRSPILRLYLENSIVGFGAAAVKADKTQVEIQRCTMFGSVGVKSIEAGNCIFTGKITATRKQEGCMRFSYAPDKSETPRRFRCQPDLALSERAKELNKNSADDLSPSEKALILARLQPGFTSTHFGDPGYAQLSMTCAEEVRAGAEDGSEMGVFSFLKQPQRAANLKVSLDEYLRYGLKAGIVYVT